jgi:glycosyltransferase involved in cell wall biosynthesis
MRIAIDYTPAIAQGAGIGRYVRSLADGLLAVNRDDTLLLCSAEAPSSDHPFPQGDAVETRVYSLAGQPVGNRALTILWQRLRLPLPVELLTGRVDVYHGTDFALPPARATPRIVTIHDLAYLSHPQYAVPGLVRYLSAAVPRSLRRADAIITLSERTADDLRRHYHVARERITVIPPGVDAAFAPVTDARALATVDARYRLEHPLALAVGTIEPRKQYDRLIAAFAAAGRRPGGPRMLALAGRRGWLAEGVFRAIEEYHVAEAVRVLDYVPPDDLAGLYSTADVLAMPSAYEGFGLPVIEAMACGTPVICSDGGALPETGGDAAMIVPVGATEHLAEALAAVVGDLARHAQMRRRGLAHAATFRWERAARQHLEVYHQVGGKRGW